MAMELPFGKPPTTTMNGQVPNGTLESSPILPQQDLDLGEFLNIRIRIADTDVQKAVCFRKDEKIWNMKQHVLQCPDVELGDSRNYGFYMLPQNNKAGKFLDEERLLSDYPLDRTRAYLEFRYKKRVYRQLDINVVQLKKYHTKSNLKQFMDHIRNKQLDKINKMADKGLDPNFHEESTGESPLTVAVTLERCEELIKVLVNGGAHLDYRSRSGFTPVHRAVQKGNTNALDILLDLGASPNSKDDRGLSPLHYSIVTNSETNVTELLLKDCAEVTPVDSQGWGLIHHACRYGRSQALKLLLLYGASIASVNEAGNTPLHVSALYNQERCALMLLDRGADKGAKNKANQTSFQVAILANNFDLAEEIRGHTGVILDTAQETPTFSKRRRWAGYLGSTQSLSQAKGQSLLDQNEDRFGPRSRLSLSAIPPPPPHERRISNGSAGGAHPGMAPMVHRRVKEAPKGRFYIAKQNYSAQEVGELSLHKGDHVEVIAIGEYNFWQGRVAHSMGWFPSYCVEEVTPKAKKSQSKQNLNENEPVSNSVPSFDGPETRQSAIPRITCVQRGKKGFGFVLRGAKSPQGGAVAFNPTKEFPALQYLEHVDKGSPADKAGLKMGDFILEINGEDVSTAPHQYVVQLVISSPDTIVMKVITVPGSKAYSWLKEGGTLKRQSPSLPISTQTTKSIQMSSQELHAVEELDKAIESGSSTPKFPSPASSRSPSIQGDETKIASIRKRPSRQQMSPQQLDGIFQRQGSSSSDGAVPPLPAATTLQRPTVPVPPASYKFNTVARMSNAKIAYQSNIRSPQSPEDVADGRRNSGGSDSAVSSLRSSPGSSHSYMTSSTASVTDSAVHLKTERTVSDPALDVVDVKNVSPKSLQGTVKKPSPLPPTRSQSLMNLSMANAAASNTSSPIMGRSSNSSYTLMSPNGPLSASMTTVAIPIDVEVHRSASGNESSDDSSSTSSFASAIALAAAKMEKKKGSTEKLGTEEKPKSSSPFELAMAAKQNYAQASTVTDGQNLNRNQNQNVENPSNTQAALQAAIAKRNQRLTNTTETKAVDIEERIKQYKKQDKAAQPKSGHAVLLDAIAKRRSIVETQSPSSEDDSSSESSPSSPMNRIPPKPLPSNQKNNAGNTRPFTGDIAKAASAMQGKISSRPPIKEDSSLNRHKNAVRISPRGKSDDGVDSSDGDSTPPISVKSLKQSFEKPKKPLPRDTKLSPLSPVKEDEALADAPIPPPPAFTPASPEEAQQKFSNLMERFQKESPLHQMDIDIVPPPPSFMEDGDHGRFRREQPFDTASMMSSASSISTMSSYSTMSTDPSSSDGFDPIGEDHQSNSNTLRSDASSSSSSTLTALSTGETNDNWVKSSPPVPTKPTKTNGVTNDNEMTNGMTNGNDNDPIKGKSISEWSVEDVSAWLEQLNLGEYCESFTENAISGEHLTSLGKDDLSELGVKRLGHRLTITKALQKLQE